VGSVTSILRRLSRDNQVRGVIVRNVDVSRKVEPSDAWSAEARYVYFERIGIGDDLGMDEAAARVVAFREAQAVHLRETRSKP